MSTIRCWSVPPAGGRCWFSRRSARGARAKGDRVVGLLLGLRYVPRGAPAAIGRLDWPGLALISIGIPALVYGFTRWGERATFLEPDVAGPVTLGVSCLVAFVLANRRTASPVLDLGLFANRAYAAASATTGTAAAAMFGAGLLFPLYFLIVRGEDALTTGVLLISLSLGTTLVLPISGWLVDRFGGGVVSVAGALASVATTVPFAVLDIDANGVLVQVLLLVRGAALALTMVPATTGAYKAVTTDQLPDATTLVNILLRVGGALGGALVAVVLAARLPDGVQTAFHTTFWWLVAASVLGLACSAWLAAAKRASPVHNRRHPAASRG